MYQSPNEGELRAFMILSSVYVENNTLQSEETKLAVEIYKAYESKDIEKYFRLFKRAPYLISCCCVYTIDEMRKHSMTILSNSIKDTVNIDGQPSIRFKIDLD